MKIFLSIFGYLLAIVLAILLFQQCNKKVIVPQDNSDSVRTVINHLHDSTKMVLAFKDSVIGDQQIKIIDLSNQVKNLRTHERIGYDSLQHLKTLISESKTDSAKMINYCKDYIDLTDQLANAVSVEHDKNDSLLTLLYSDTSLYRDQITALQSENKRLQEIIETVLQEKSDLRAQLIAALKRQKKPWLVLAIGLLLGAATNLIHR